MQIYVIGGSNSIQADGWTRTFAEIFPDIVVNRSIGASNSLMGYYRATEGMDLQPGDVLIWEYALNDQYFCDKRDYAPEDLLQHLEALLRLCAEREVVVLPLLLTPPRWFFASEDTAYMRALKALLWHYELTFVDVKALMMRLYPLAVLKEGLFENANHIRPGSVYAAHIAEAAAEALQAPRIPAHAPPLYAVDGSGAVYGNTFLQGAPFELSNRLVCVSGRRPDPVATLVAPLTGEVMALIALASARGGGFEMRYRYRDMRLSLTSEDTSFTKPMLKLIYLPRTLASPLYAQKGEPLKFRWLDKPGRTRADFGLRGMLDAEDLAGRDGAIIGCLMRETAQAVAAQKAVQT